MPPVVAQRLLEDLILPMAAHVALSTVLYALLTVARDDFARLEAMIDGDLAIAVTPPVEAIARWKTALGQTLEAGRGR